MSKELETFVNDIIEMYINSEINETCAHSWGDIDAQIKSLKEEGEELKEKAKGLIYASTN